MATMPGCSAPLRVHYVRHGQSVWNMEQAEHRATGAPEDEVKALGSLDRYTDSPLSATGVGQALALRRLLFPREKADTESYSRGAYETAMEPCRSTRSLSRFLRCAAAGEAPRPRVFTSNLRRAIATLLLALKPALESPAFEAPAVSVLPALQETCPHADCSPIARTNRGKLLDPLGEPRCASCELAVPAHVLDQLDPAVARLTETVLLVEARQLAAAAADERSRPPPAPLALEAALAAAGLARPAAEGEPIGAFSLNSYLQQTYASHLQLARHTTYDDRRRVPSGALSSSLAAAAAAEHRAGAALATTLAPLLSRMADVLHALLPPAPTAPPAPGVKANCSGEPAAAVVVAHSRLLREWLFVFLAGLEVPPSASGEPGLALGWGPDNDAACAQLASEDFKLSNTGAVTFDLEVCGPPACASPTLKLCRCALDAGGFVYPRNGGAALASHVATPSALESVVDVLAGLPAESRLALELAAGLAALALVALLPRCCRARRVAAAPSDARRKKKRK